MPNKNTSYSFLASIDIDAQQCFSPLCPDELPVPEGDQIVDELNTQSDYAKLRVGSKDAHSPHALWVTHDVSKVAGNLEETLKREHNNIDAYWPVHAVPGTKGFELLPGLPKPANYDYFVWKGIELDMHPYGACYHDLDEKISTGLTEFLKINNITHVVAGGLSLEFCVKVTVMQLVKAGFTVIVNLAATRYIYPDLAEQALAELKSLGVIFISDSKELAKVINNIL